MVYFLIYLFIEVVISVNISSYIGALMTFFAIVFTALIGIVILINFKGTMRENLTAVSYSCIDLHQFQSLNLFTLLGAIFLIVPGFVTDILGILMQFSVFTTMLVNRFHMDSMNCKTDFKENKNKKDMDVIDVEIVSDNANLR